MKVMFFGLILIVTAFSSVSQEIQSNGFSLTLGNPLCQDSCRLSFS